MRVQIVKHHYFVGLEAETKIASMVVLASCEVTAQREAIRIATSERALQWRVVTTKKLPQQ